MQPVNVADGKQPAPADLEFLEERALERHRRVAQPRRSDDRAGTQRESQYLRFADFWRIRSAAGMHPIGESLIDQIHNKFAGVDDVACAVLQRAVGPALEAHDQNGRIVAHQVKEAVGRGIDDAGGALRGQERDGPWQHQAGQ